MRTAEDLLIEKGWASATTSMKAADITSHLYQPQKWIPKGISRFFLNEEVKNVLVYVGVLLDWDYSWKGFDEPWVTCGVFQFMQGVDPTEDLELEWIDAHLTDQHDPDGTFYPYRWPQEKIESEESEGEIYRATMALPLVGIKNADDLEKRVITPLLEEVAKIKKVSKD